MDIPRFKFKQHIEGRDLLNVFGKDELTQTIYMLLSKLTEIMSLSKNILVLSLLPVTVSEGLDFVEIGKHSLILKNKLLNCLNEERYWNLAIIYWSLHCILNRNIYTSSPFY